MSNAVFTTRRRSLLPRKAALLLSLGLAPFWLLNAAANFPWIVPADGNFTAARAGERTALSGLLLGIASMMLSLVVAALRGRSATVGTALAGALWLASAFSSPLFESPVRSVAWTLTAVAVAFATFARFRHSKRPENSVAPPLAKIGSSNVPYHSENS